MAQNSTYLKIVLPLIFGEVELFEKRLVEENFFLK